MMILPLAKISILWNLFAFLWLLLAAGLILIVLIQKGRGGGISGAFGGGGGANSLLGTKTGDFLTWVTICLVSLFLTGAIVMGKYMRPAVGSELIPVTSSVQQAEQPVGEQPTVPAEGVDQAAQTADTAVQSAQEDVEKTVQSDESAAEPVQTPAGQN